MVAWSGRLRNQCHACNEAKITEARRRATEGERLALAEVLRRIHRWKAVPHEYAPDFYVEFDQEVMDEVARKLVLSVKQAQAAPRDVSGMTELIYGVEQFSLLLEFVFRERAEREAALWEVLGRGGTWRALRDADPVWWVYR